MDLLKRDDEYYMRVALRQAEQAFAADEVPIGAVVVYKGEVIARAYNQVEMLKDATAHAEILAITQAESTLENWRLEECTLYVTKEPCAMCAGAMVNARVKKCVFGMKDSRSGGAGGALDITGFPGMLHQVEVVAGILEEDCTWLVQDFFRQKRLQRKAEKDILLPSSADGC